MKLTTLALLTTVAASAMPATTTHRLPFIEDDYGKARAEARARHLPLFVDVWAPW